MSGVLRRLLERGDRDAAAARTVADRLPKARTGAEIVVYEVPAPLLPDARSMVAPPGRYVWEVYEGGRFVAHGAPEFTDAQAWRAARNALPLLGLAVLPLDAAA